MKNYSCWSTFNMFCIYVYIAAISTVITFDIFIGYYKINKTKHEMRKMIITYVSVGIVEKKIEYNSNSDEEQKSASNEKFVSIKICFYLSFLARVSWKCRNKIQIFYFSWKHLYIRSLHPELYPSTEVVVEVKEEEEEAQFLIICSLNVIHVMA